MCRCKIVQGGISLEASDMEFTITKCVNEIEYRTSVDGPSVQQRVRKVSVGA